MMFGPRGSTGSVRNVEAGRSVLTSIAADIDPPEGEVADILRRLAISLLADIPEMQPASRRARAATATASPG
jgi:hypothetical protein